MSYTRESGDGSSSQRGTGSEDLLLIYKTASQGYKAKLKFYRNGKKFNAHSYLGWKRQSLQIYSDMEIFTSKTFTRSLMVQLVWINIIEAFTERPFWKVDHLVAILRFCWENKQKFSSVVEWLYEFWLWVILYPTPRIRHSSSCCSITKKSPVLWCWPMVCC